MGIAYSYYDDSSQSSITNCAIAGYNIEDHSRNKLGLGEAVVGGLIGVSSLDLNGCSAVVDIVIDCTHRNDQNKMNQAPWGNFVRVGGLVGGVQYKVTNCYTGGTITVSNDTLEERVRSSSSGPYFAGWEETANQQEQVRMTTNIVSGLDTYVYLGGIGGSGFSSTFKNFGAVKDGKPDFENCYTYMTFPKMQGTITAISLIGSVADRYGYAESMKITNCYYLDSSAAIDFDNLPKYYGKYDWKLEGLKLVYTYYSLHNILDTEGKRQAMLNGDLSYLGDYAKDAAKPGIYYINGLTPLTYEQMSDRIGGEGFIKAQNGSAAEYTTFRLALNKNKEDGAFGWVTVEEAQAEVHGKYSFPGKNIAVLDGQDYPFPTVLTQASEHTDSRRANLHYGDWPLVGPAWEKSSVTIDRITDYDAKTGAPVITAVLKLENMEDGKLGGLTLESFRSTNESIARVTGFEPLDAKSCRVTLVGLANGSVEITAALDGHVARLMVSATAELTIRMSDEIERAKQITVNENAAVRLGLAALDRGGKALTKDLSWTVANAETGAAQIDWKNGVPQSVRGIGAGETTLLITASYRINATETVTVSRIVPVTVLAKAADGTA